MGRENKGWEGRGREGIGGGGKVEKRKARDRRGRQGWEGREGNNFKNQTNIVERSTIKNGKSTDQQARIQMSDRHPSIQEWANKLAGQLYGTIIVLTIYFVYIEKKYHSSIEKKYHSSPPPLPWLH